MPGNVPIAATAVLAVCTYYLFAWLFFGRDPKPGVVVPAYEPPRNLSPAMLRYVWKQGFDDRTFWAGVLSLVAKGLATLHAENGSTRLCPAPAANLKQVLSDEEEILLGRLVRGRTRKGIVITMLDPRTALIAGDMAASLHQNAVGRWFEENRRYVTIGASLSIIALAAVAQPQRLELWGVLGWTLVLMSPAGFYFCFLLMRLRDLFRAQLQRFDTVVLQRTAILFALLASCVAGFVLGAVVLGVNFGWPFLLVTLFLTIFNILQLHWMKAPTNEGAQLRTEIEGFRLFLESVERLPMQRSDTPSDRAGLYEKYLPYAVALEVEQAWSDQFLALASTFHQNAGLPGAESFYLGLWEGKPVEIVYGPQRPTSR